MKRVASFCALALSACLLFLTACGVRQYTIRTSTLEYLYPQGKEAEPAADVTLEVPIRVGLAFAPGAFSGSENPITEAQRLALLERVGAAFKVRSEIASIEVIPSTYLVSKGSFQNLDQLRSAFGVDLVALLSYEQTRFTSSTGRSIAYWTIVGAYIVNGEKNETSTVLEAVVYDIRSRAMLFRAAGTNHSQGRGTAVGADRKFAEIAAQGLELAADDLIPQLEVALDGFVLQARQGSVRGAGTPGVTVVNANGAPAGAGGAGHTGLLGLCLVGALGILAATHRTRPHGGPLSEL